MKNAILKIFNPQNEFFTLTSNAKRLPHIAFSSLILPLLFILLASFFERFVVEPLLHGGPGQGSDFENTASNLYVMFGALIVVVFLWLRFFEGRSFCSLGFTSKNFLKKYLFGFATGLGMNVAIVGIMFLFGAVEIDSNGTSTTGMMVFGGITIMLFGFIIQGGSEEILFRGWMFQVIGAKYRPWIGALISSLFFALLHLGNSNVNVFAVINLFLFATLMVLYVMKDGSVWAACAWHSSWNWTMGNVLGLSVSGHGEQVSLFDFNATGNEIISGGWFGPEGSMITSVVLLTANIFFVVRILNNDK